MLDKITQDKKILEAFIKIAQKQAKSSRPSDVFESLLKVAEVTDIKRLIMNINEDLDFEFSKARLNREENNVLRQSLLDKIDDNNLSDPILQPFIEVINKNFASLYEIANSTIQYMKDQSKQHGEELITLMFTENPLKGSKVSRNIWRYILLELFENKSANVLKSINAITGTASLVAKRDRGTSFETGGVEGSEMQIANPNQLSVTDELSGEQKLQLMKKQIDEILAAPNMFLIQYLIEPQIPESFKKDTKSFKNYYDEYLLQLKNASTTEELASAEENINNFFDEFVSFIKENMDVGKRYTPKNIYREKTLRDLQRMCGEIIDQLDLDNLVDDIINSPYYKLPKHIEVELKENQLMVKELIKAAIQSEVVMNLKEREDIPVRRTKDKKNKTSQIDILYNFLYKAINKIETDPEKQEELKRRALLLTKEKYTKEGKDNVSEIAGRIYQHVTPMIKSGLIFKYVRDTGKEFAELTPEEKTNIMKRVHETVYPVFKVMDFSKNKYKALRSLYDEEKHKELTEKQIKEKLGLSEEPEDSRESNALALLIKKYAFKH
jgi:hypothetical protein